MVTRRAPVGYRRLYNRHARRLLEHYESPGGAFFNRCIEWPVVKELLPDEIGGRRILDIGCGIGDFTGWLVDQGAWVKAIDCSEEMIAIAAERQDSVRVEFEAVSFEELPEESSEFHHAVASFMIGYFSSLDDFFQKVRGLLVERGTLIVSMLHPIRALSSRKVEDGYVVRRYFDEKIYEADFLGRDAVIPLHPWRFSDVVSSATASGFVLDALHEPRLGEDCREDVRFYVHSPSVAVMRFRRDFR